MYVRTQRLREQRRNRVADLRVLRDLDASPMGARRLLGAELELVGERLEPREFADSWHSGLHGVHEIIGKAHDRR